MQEPTTLVETVLGPVPDDHLGIIMPHEHFPVYRNWEGIEPPDGYREKLEQMQAAAMRDAATFGVRTLVEVTPRGLGRLVPMMQRLSRSTGMHVVPSTGFYTETNHPEWAKKSSEQELAAFFIRELTEGLDGVFAKAWMIKIASNSAELSAQDRKVFRAAAAASRATGAAITTHSCGAVQAHFDFLVKAGADPDRLYLGHADFGPEDNREQLHVARNGGHLIFTCWGIHHFVDQDVLRNRVVSLVEAGFEDAVLLSIDYALELHENRMFLMSTEYECAHRTPGFLFRYALPRLRERGITDNLIHHFLVENTRAMLRRPTGKALLAASAPQREAMAIRSGLERRPFSEQTEADALTVANNSLTGWPYTRAIDAHLVEYWKGLPQFQPDHLWIAYRDGHPRAFLHGEREGESLYIHLLALMPGAVEEGVWLLGEMEAHARRQGITRLVGPHYRASAFYGAYVLGCEPYHPHWAIDGTEAWVRAGFRISHPAVLMVRKLAAPVTVNAVQPDYEIEESPAREEFDARTFGFHAVFHGETVAHCYARLYPNLLDRGGLPVGQIGYVGTADAHQGKGLATVMTRMCLARLRDWGAGECLIATGLDNYAALRAYEKAGFERRYNLNEWSKALSSQTSTVRA